MRKIFMMLVAAVIAFGSIACSSDDGNSSSSISYQNAIKGEWKESKNVYLDKNKKEVMEMKLANEGCPNRRMDFKDEIVIETDFFKDSSDEACSEYKSRARYEIIKNRLNFVYEDGDAIYVYGYVITEITADKLVYLMEDYALDGTLLGYLQFVYVRI